MKLVGSNEHKTSEMCNVFSRIRFCDNVHLHVGAKIPESVIGQQSIDGKIGVGQAVVFPSATHCSDPLCPVCCFSWAKKTVKRAMLRFQVFDDYFGEDFEKRHITVSVPMFDWDKPLSFLRKQVVAFVGAVGCVGGNIIFHPKRLDHRSKSWYFSPHFHVVGYVRGGWVDGFAVSMIHNMSGYVLKNLGKRKSVVGTLFYQLSHAGVVGGHRSAVCWFGECNSRNTKAYGFSDVIKQNDRDMRRLASEQFVCPVCGSKLKRCCRAADKPFFDYKRFEDSFVLDSVDNWVVLPDFPQRHSYKYSKDEDDLFDAYDKSG